MTRPLQRRLEYSTSIHHGSSLSSKLYPFKIPICLRVGFRWSRNGSPRYDDSACYQKTLQETVTGYHWM